VFDVFDTYPPILLQPLPQACSPQLWHHQPYVIYTAWTKHYEQLLFQWHRLTMWIQVKAMIPY
jgi:hypothetical protein